MLFEGNKQWQREKKKEKSVRQTHSRSEKVEKERKIGTERE